MPPLKPIAGRINRNSRNSMETFPLFAAAVLIAEAAGVHNGLSLWGGAAYLGGRFGYTLLYVAGIPLIRSLFWNIAAFGMLAVLAAPFIRGRRKSVQEFLLANYLWIKALHIIAVIAWMAGMLYLPRLFVYHHQAQKGGEAEQLFIGMERRLLNFITTPALIAVWLFAGLMIFANQALLSSGWFLWKLAAVIGISGLHGYFAAAQKKFARGERPMTEKFWRMINEGPTLLMIAAAILAVLKPF